MVTRGFGGSRRDSSSDVPPGQFVVNDFPMLTAGPTPRISTDDWQLILDDGANATTFTWDEFNELEPVDVTVDIHCVTRWSKLGTTWSGVAIATLVEAAALEPGPFALITSYGEYTTNLPTEDLLRDGSMVATKFDGAPLDPEHGGPARLLVPHLYLWKSAKWVTEIRFDDYDTPGFWEVAGYHNYGDPWREQRYYND